MLRDRGYTGSHRAVAACGGASASAANKRRFCACKVFAGEQAQVDWASFGTVMVGHAKRATELFRETLSWSRALYLEFFFDQTMESFLRGHVNAFRYFSGAARIALYDN